MNILTFGLFCQIQLEEEKKPQKPFNKLHRTVVSVQEESMNQEKHVTDYHLYNRNIQFIHCKGKHLKEML